MPKSRTRWNRFALFLMTIFIGISSASEVTADQTSSHEEGLKSNPANVWALQHATVVTRAGNQIDDATIVIRNGRIAVVQAKAAAPASARVIDLSGKTIYPGFIDAYAEIKTEVASAVQTNGYWNPNVVPQVSVSSAYQQRDDNAAVRAQGVVARLIAPSEKIVRGTSAVVSTSGAEFRLALINPNVAQHMQLTVMSRGRDTYPGSPMGAVALARQAMYDAKWYGKAWLAANANQSLPRPEYNDALEALQPVINGQQPAFVETYNELYFLRAVRFAEEFGLNLIVRGSGHEYRRLPDIAATRRPVILPLNFEKAPNVSTVEAAANVTLESLMHWDIAPENPARVAQAGMTFAFTMEGLTSSDKFLKALRLAVDRGLDSTAALRALTETPAHLYNIDSELGTIEVGKRASFVVTDGDLFDKKTKIVATWVDGSRFEHKPEPRRLLEGRYELRLRKVKGLPAKLHLQLDRDGKSASGRMSAHPLKDLPKEDSKPDDETSDDDEHAIEEHSSHDHGDHHQDDHHDHQHRLADQDDDEIAAGEPKEDDSDSPEMKLKQVSLNDFSATAVFESSKLSSKKKSLDGSARITIVFSERVKNDPKAAAGFGRIVWPSGEVSPCSVFPVAEGQVDSDEDVSGHSNDSDGAEAKPASFAVNYPLGAFGQKAPVTKSQGLTALTNATVWTCGDAGILQNATVLMNDGKIVAVGQELAIPETAFVVDLKGRHLSPGIIDCHSHMATDGGVNESTQALTCEVRIGDFVDCDDITIYRQLAGGVTCANVLHGSANPIGGQNQVIKLRWGQNGEAMKFAEAPQGVKFALGENVKQSNWGDEYTTRYPQTRMGVEQIFRDSFTAAVEYRRRHERYRRNPHGLPPRIDLELEALAEIVEGSRWIHCHSYRQDEILSLMKVLDDYKITIGTFQHILEGYKVADAMAKHGAMGSAFSDWWAYKFEVYDGIPYGGALMHEAGVIVSFNSDDAELATRLNQEAAKAVKYGGVSREEALKFVTLNPAIQLRIDQYVGSIEVGKQADLAVWSGDPLSNYSKCEQTWIDGVIYFDRDQDNAARKEVAVMRNTLVQKILTSGVKMRGVGDKDDDPSSLWPRHDEFCHHDHDHDDHGHSHE
ncbi:MAG: amidohydrolase family protein [Fuerstiella sp.]